MEDVLDWSTLLAEPTAGERQDPDNPGKGQSIDWFLQRTELAAYDAAAFIDAANLVSPLFFAR